MPEERTHKSFWFPRSIDVKDNKIRFEGGSWESIWTTEGTMVRDNKSTNSPESDYRNALDRAANEDYPGHPVLTDYRQRIMDQLISRPRIFAYHDTLRELVLGNHLDGFFRGIDVNVAASGAGRHSRFDLAAAAGGGGAAAAAGGGGAAAAAAGGGAGDDEGDEEDDDDYPDTLSA